MTKSKLTKIVYFDEQTALDFVEIRDKGRYIREIENENKGDASITTEASANSRNICLLYP